MYCPPGQDDGRGVPRLDIAAVAEGYSLAGVVVNDGPSARVHTPGEAGLTERPPWEDLAVSPDWFACVTPAAERTITLRIADGELVRGPAETVSIGLGQPVRIELPRRPA